MSLAICKLLDCLVEIDVSLVTNGTAEIDDNCDDPLPFQEVGLELAEDTDAASATEIVGDISLVWAALDELQVLDSEILMTDWSSNGQRTL